MRKTEDLRERVYTEEDSAEVRRIWAMNADKSQRRTVVTVAEFMKMKTAGLDTENFVTLNDIKQKPIYRKPQEELSEKDRSVLRETKKSWA